MAIAKHALEGLKKIVGASGYLSASADKYPYLHDERGLYEGDSPLVLLPSNTQQVSGIVSLCDGAGITVVPQGGNTGMCGAATPDGSGGQIVLALSRMHKIRSVDPLNYTLTAEAGCVLADIQQAAADADRLFPLSLAAEGSCQIGGNLSTNAGGTAVLRYGNARELVLGLEVVLPNGDIWNGLRRLRKDNAGYDVKQMFLGAEGTLGVITAAVLKLFPTSRETATALVAVRDPDAALVLLARLRSLTSDDVTSFEYIHRQCLDLVFEKIEGTRDPLDSRYLHYALIELSSAQRNADLQTRLGEAFVEGLESGQILDGVVASSESQANALWALRETVPEAQKRSGLCVKHDVSIPISEIPVFLAKATALCESTIPGVRVAPFGHMGDGNIHFNLCQPLDTNAAIFQMQGVKIAREVHDLTVALGGSFSAEHGIGQLKLDELQRYKSSTEMKLMTAIKSALDPNGTMNPGKIL